MPPSNETSDRTKGVRGEFIAGPFDGLPGMLNGFYRGKIVALVCDYSGRYAHISSEQLEHFFKETPKPAQQH